MLKNALLLFFLCTSSIGFACSCGTINTTLCGNIEEDDMVLMIKKIEQINAHVIQCEVLDVIMGESTVDTIHLIYGGWGSSCSEVFSLNSDTSIIKGIQYWSPYPNTFSLGPCDHYISSIHNDKVIESGPIYDSPPSYAEWVDNLQECINLPPTRYFFGYLKTPMNTNVNDALLKGVQEYSYSAITDSTYSSFYFSDFVEGDTLVAYKNDDLDNAVSISDIIALRKHILGVELFDNPYQYIAADINHSNSISTLDLIKIQKIILHLTEELPNNTSWRFIDAAYSFPVPNNPWYEVFPEFIIPNSTHFLYDNSQSLGFIGIKIGDVNLSVEG